MFGLSMRKILTVFGAAMMLFVIANVQFGSVAPQVIDGAEGYKLDAFLMFEPSCSFDAVEEELKTSGTSYCLGEIGQWSGADLLMMMEGLFLFVYGFELPQNKGWARRLRRSASSWARCCAPSLSWTDFPCCPRRRVRKDWPRCSPSCGGLGRSDHVRRHWRVDDSGPEILGGRSGFANSRQA